ncbi:MAG: FtsX-like permease family protein, partial [Chitinophagaceae bacterium]
MTAFKLIGVFLILMACVNFINLSTANAVNRSREVGIRKVLGSRKGQLILQFFGETAATSTTAMMGALALAAVVLTFLNNLLEINIPVTALWSSENVVFMTGTLIIVTMLAGFYPALILAGFNPIQALTNKIKSESGGGLTLRRGLVIFQFVIAQIMIIGTLIVVSQINYFNNADLGFNKQAIINAGFPGDSASRSKADLLRSQVMAIPGVKQFSLSYFPISAQGGWATDLLLAGNTSGKSDAIVQMKPADTAYFSVHDLKLVAGRRFFASDTVREFMVNEALVNELKTTPEKVVGMMVKVGGVDAPIVGVVKDFHLKSLKERIEPVVMTTNKRQYRTTNIRIEPNKTKEVISAMTKIWNQHFPSYVFEYNFLDQTIADYYRHEEQLSKLYKIFAGIAVFIS